MQTVALKIDKGQVTAMRNPIILATIGGITLTSLSGCGPGPVSFGETFYSNPSPKRVAVLPFDSANGESGNMSDGETVAALLTDALVAVRAYHVTERSKLKKVLAEHKLTTSKFVQERGLKQAGDLLDADMLVLGNVNRFRQEGGLWPSAEISLSVRCVDVNSGDIVWAVSPDKKAFGGIRNLTKSLCHDIALTIQTEYENANRTPKTPVPSSARNLRSSNPSGVRPEPAKRPPSTTSASHRDSAKETPKADTSDRKTPTSTGPNESNGDTPAESTGAGLGWPRRHRVREGDTLSDLSMHYYDSGRLVGHILKVNRQIKNPHRLKIGQTILIPAPPKLATVRSTTGEP